MLEVGLWSPQVHTRVHTHPHTPTHTHTHVLLSAHKNVSMHADELTQVGKSDRLRDIQVLTYKRMSEEDIHDAEVTVRTSIKENVLENPHSCLRNE